jgi:hypothetical protein
MDPPSEGFYRPLLRSSLRLPFIFLIKPTLQEQTSGTTCLYRNKRKKTPVTPFKSKNRYYIFFLYLRFKRLGGGAVFFFEQIEHG